MFFQMLTKPKLTLRSNTRRPWQIRTNLVQTSIWSKLRVVKRESNYQVGYKIRGNRYNYRTTTIAPTNSVITLRTFANQLVISLLMTLSLCFTSCVDHGESFLSKLSPS